MIAAVLALARHVDPPILSLAFGVLLGGVGQLLIQVPDLRRIGLLVAPSRDLRHPALIRIARLLLPAVFGLAAVQVMVFVNTLLASLLPVGSISFLYYADRVMEFPLGIFGIALASASLPAMARQAAARDTARRGRHAQLRPAAGRVRVDPGHRGARAVRARRSLACSSSGVDSGRRIRRPPRSR